MLKFRGHIVFKVLVFAVLLGIGMLGVHFMAHQAHPDEAQHQTPFSNHAKDSHPCPVCQLFLSLIFIGAAIYFLIHAKNEFKTAASSDLRLPLFDSIQSFHSRAPPSLI